MINLKHFSNLKILKFSNKIAVVSMNVCVCVFRAGLIPYQFEKSYFIFEYQVSYLHSLLTRSF